MKQKKHTKKRAFLLYAPNTPFKPKIVKSKKVYSRKNVKTIKAGQKLKADSGFTCIPPNAIRTIFSWDNEFYVCCKHGKHFLNGQTDNFGNLVGFEYASPGDSFSGSSEASNV
jgi:hypothetical protein